MAGERSRTLPFSLGLATHKQRRGIFDKPARTKKLVIEKRVYIPNQFSRVFTFEQIVVLVIASSHVVDRGDSCKLSGENCRTKAVFPCETFFSVQQNAESIFRSRSLLQDIYHSSTQYYHQKLLHTASCTHYHLVYFI